MRISSINKELNISSSEKKYIRMVYKNLAPTIDQKHLLAFVEVFGVDEFMDSTFLRQFVDTYQNKIEFAKEHYRILSESGASIPKIRNKKEWENYAQELFSKEYIFNRKCVFVRNSNKSA